METRGGVSGLENGQYEPIVTMTVASLLVVEGGGEDAPRRLARGVRFTWYSAGHASRALTSIVYICICNTCTSLPEQRFQ